MTRTTPQLTDRAPLTRPPQRRRPPWMWAVAALVAIGAVVIGLALWWPDGEDEAALTTTTAATTTTTTVTTTTVPPVAGELVWLQAIDVPGERFLAITATPDGFLAASPGSVGGVDFWTSEDGFSWRLLVSEQTAFAGEAVWSLESGPSGYVAIAESWPPQPWPGPSLRTVWTSPDGETWHRSHLVADLADDPSPYVRPDFTVEYVASGPVGFVAIGSGGPTFDHEAILADFAPDASTQIVGSGTRWDPEPALEIHTAAGEEIVIPLADLGIADPEEMAVGEESAARVMLGWRSTDGASWEPIDPAAAGLEAAGMAVSDLIGKGDGFYLFTASQLGYRSADGVAWESFAMDGLPTEIWFEVFDVEEGFLAIGSGDTGDTAWTSAEGEHWSPLPEGALFDVAPDTSLGINIVAAGPAGVVISGSSMTEQENFEEPEIIVRKDGYELTLGYPTWILVEAATGDVVAEVDAETMTGENVQFDEEDFVVSFSDPSTGAVFLEIGDQDVQAAAEAAFETAGVQLTPTPILGYSRDGEAWTWDDAQALFGDDAFVLRAAVGADRTVALVSADATSWWRFEAGEAAEAELPPVAVWVGRPRT